MNRHLACAVALVIATGMTGCATTPPALTDNSKASMPAPAAQDNPFFEESTLPLKYPVFDKIKDSDFGPAFDRGMADQLKEVEAIADNAEPATFDNTIVALEKSGQVLTRAATVFFSLTGADTNPTREKLQADYAAKLSAHGDAIALNPKLFARIKSLHDSRHSLGLSPEGVRLIERYYTDFVRSGANLTESHEAWEWRMGLRRQLRRMEDRQLLAREHAERSPRGSGSRTTC